MTIAVDMGRKATKTNKQTNKDILFQISNYFEKLKFEIFKVLLQW